MIIKRFLKIKISWRILEDKRNILKQNECIKAWQKNFDYNKIYRGV